MISPGEDVFNYKFEEDDNNNENESDEWADSMVTYALDLGTEKKNPIRKNFLKNSGLNTGQREHAMNWILSTFKDLDEYEHIPEVCHLAIGIFDRFVQDDRNISAKKINLVAMICVFIAMKIEDGSDETIILTDGALISTEGYTKKEILEMEMRILKTLKCDVFIPSSFHFLTRFHLLSPPSSQENFLGMYILEIGLTSYETCHIPQSLQGAAAHFLIKAVLNQEDDFTKVWSLKLTRFTRYSTSDIIPVACQLVKALHKVTKMGVKSSLYNKYSEEEFGNVSDLVSSSHDYWKNLLECDSV